MDCGKQITIEEWCEFSEGVFICLSNCLEGHILFCFPSDLFSYMIHLDVFLRFKCLLVTSLPFFFSMTQVLLLWEIVKLWNTSDLMLLPFCQPKGHSEVFAPWTGRKVGKCALQEDCWAGVGLVGEGIDMFSYISELTQKWERSHFCSLWRYYGGFVNTLVSPSPNHRLRNPLC